MGKIDLNRNNLKFGSSLSCASCAVWRPVTHSGWRWKSKLHLRNKPRTKRRPHLQTQTNPHRQKALDFLLANINVSEMTQLTFQVQLRPVSKQNLSTWSNSTVISPSVRLTQVLYRQIVHAGVCLCVLAFLTLIVVSSVGVNESWMRFSRVSEPVNTVFSTTAPSLDCTVQSHRASRLDGSRFRLTDPSCVFQKRILHADRSTLPKLKHKWNATCTKVSSCVWWF